MVDGVSWDLNPLETTKQQILHGFDLDAAIENTKSALGVKDMPDGVMVVNHNTRRGSFVPGSDWDTIAGELIKLGLASDVTEQPKGFKPKDSKSRKK
jgi:hypothetical protein